MPSFSVRVIPPPEVLADVRPFTDAIIGRLAPLVTDPLHAVDLVRRIGKHRLTMHFDVVSEIDLGDAGHARSRPTDVLADEPPPPRAEKPPNPAANGRRGRPVGNCARDIGAALKDGPRSFSEIVEALADKHGERTITRTLAGLVDLGTVEHPDPTGEYWLTDLGN